MTQDNLNVKLSGTDTLSPILAGLPLKFLGATAALAGLTKAMLSSVKASEEFETALASVSTLVDTSVVNMDDFKTSLQEMSGDVIQAPKELAEGLYQVVSASIDTSKAIEVLRVSAIAATGGMTDTFTAVDGITSVLNAYNLEATEAGRVSDAMFTAVKLGKTTFEELSGSIGKVLPVANEMGVSVEELMGALAALTLKGLSTEEATTALRATMSSMLKPTKQSAEAAEALGIDWSRAAVQSNGLLHVMSELSQATDGNKDAMAQLVPNIRGYIGALSLSSDEAAKFSEISVKMSDIVGASGVAFDKMAATSENATKRMKIAFKNLQIDIGDALKPIKVSIVSTMADAFQGMRTGFKLIGALWDLFLALYGKQFNALKATVKSAFDNVVESIEVGVLAVSGFVSRLITPLVDKLKPVFNAMVAFLSTALSEVTSIVIAGINDFIGYASITIPIIADTIFEIFQSIVQFLDDIGLFKGLEATFNAMTTFVKAWSPVVTKFISDAFDAIFVIVEKWAPVMLETVQESLDDIAAFIKKWGPVIKDTLIASFADIKTFVTAWGPIVFDTIKKSLQDISSFVITWAPIIWNTITKTFNDLKVFATNWGPIIFEAIKGALQDITGFIGDWGEVLGVAFRRAISGLWVRVKPVFNLLVARFKNIGGKLVGGIVNGIKNTIPNLIGSITDALDRALEAAREKLGIKSPSIVFAKMGVNMMEGMATGIDKSADLPRNALDKTVNNITNNNQSFNVKVDGQGGTFSNRDTFEIENELRNLSRFNTSLLQGV